MRISSRVMKILTEEGISESELALMLDSAAITRIRKGYTSRYFHWLFKIENGVLENMQHVSFSEVGEGKTRMLEEHELCGGQGCRACGWIGEIGRWMTDKELPQHERLQFRREAVR